MSLVPTLYPDNLFKIYLANLHSSPPSPLDSRHVLEIISNDDIFYHISLLLTVPHDPENIPKATINPATGKRFILSPDYVFFYYSFGRDYYNLTGSEAINLAKNAAKKYLSSRDINYVLYLERISENTSYNLSYETKERLEQELKDNESEFEMYNKLEENVKNLDIEYSDLKNFDLTYQYSPEMDTRVFNFHNLILNERIPLVMQNNEIRVYEFAVSLSLLLDSVKETANKSLEGLVIKIFNNERYNTAIFYENESQLVILDAKPLHNDVISDFPSPIALDGINPIPPLKTNVTRTWTIYNLKLEFNMFLHAIMTDKILRQYFFVSEISSLYFLKSRPEIKFTIDGRTYNLDVHPQRLISSREVKIVRREPNKEGEEAQEKESKRRRKDQGKESVRRSAKGEDQEEEGIYQEKVQFDSGTYYVTCTLYNMIDEYRAASAQEIISGLIYNFVKESQKSIITFYKNALSNFSPRYVAGFRRGEEEGHKIYQLQAVAKDIFVSGYARVCLPDNQGIIIPENELDQWLEDNPTKRYLPFPLTEEQKKWIIKHPEERKIPVIGRHQPGITVINFASPQDIYSHPGVKRNINLPNKDIYPVIPCCYKDDQFTDKNSPLYKYIHNIPPEEDVDVIQAVAQKKIKAVGKIVTLGRFGGVPENIMNMFTTYGYGGDNIVRVGTYETTPNSFIHCIMYAVYDQRYSNLFYTPRESFVMEWRRSLVEKAILPPDERYITHNRDISIALVRQELYDDTDEKIMSMIEDSYNYDFDSKLFYRLLEHEYNLNIFVIYQPFGGEPSLEIPQHKIVHIRERRLDRPSIVVFKHHEFKEAPAHYELLRFDKKILIEPTDEFSTADLFRIFGDIYFNLVFQKESGKGAETGKGGKSEETAKTEKPAEKESSRKISPHFKLYKDIYSSFSVYDALVDANIIPIAQYLDRYCKCRGYMVKVGKYRGTILCMPQQPRALPVRSDIIPIDGKIISLFGKVSRVHIESVESGQEREPKTKGKVGKKRETGTKKGKVGASISDISRKRRVVGVWIPINDYELGFYIPIVITPDIEELESKILSDKTLKETSNPIVPWKTDGSFSQYLRIENKLQTFLSIVTLIYRKYGFRVLNKINKRLNDIIGQFRQLLDDEKDRGISDNRIKRHLARALPDLIEIDADNPSLLREYYSDVPLNKYVNHLELLIHQAYGIITKNQLEAFRNLFKVEVGADYSTANINADIFQILSRKKFKSILEQVADITDETIVKNGNIIVSSEKLKKDLYYYLDSFLIKQPLSFYGVITSSERKIRIFTTMLAFELWIDTKSNPNLIITNASSLSSDRSDPHIYRDADGILYLIQNVLYGELSRALNVAMSWRDKMGNPGYQADATTKQPPFTLYKIVGSLLETESPKNGDLLIIGYPEQKYGAILPL